VHAEPEEEKMKMTDFDVMVESIFMAWEEHGIKCADNHWMTAEEMHTLSDEEMVELFNLIYNKNVRLEDLR